MTVKNRAGDKIVRAEQESRVRANQGKTRQIAAWLDKVGQGRTGQDMVG